LLLFAQCTDKFTRCEIASVHFVDASHALEVVFTEVFKANFLEEVLLPALHTAVDADRHESLLADYTAKAPCLTASSQMCKSVRQVVKLAAVEELFWHVVLQPQDLGNFHLDRHLAAHVSQQIVVGCVDLVGLLHRAVIEPEYDIAVVAIFVVEVGPGDGDWLICVFGEHGERASCVEANAPDGIALDVVLI